MTITVPPVIVAHPLTSIPSPDASTVINPPLIVKTPVPEDSPIGPPPPGIPDPAPCPVPCILGEAPSEF